MQQVQEVDSEDDAVEIVAEEFDYLLAPITSDRARRMLYRDMVQRLPVQGPEPVRLSREDAAGGLGSVLAAVIAVVPSLAPLFLFQNQQTLAIRLSIAMSFLVLLIAGVLWGKYTGSNSWGFGLILVGVSAIMVLIVFLLGG